MEIPLEHGEHRLFTLFAVNLHLIQGSPTSARIDPTLRLLPMYDNHPSPFSEWAIRIMALVGLCILIGLSTKLIANATRGPQPTSVRSVQR